MSGKIDPRLIPLDQLKAMRLEVANEYNISFYTQYVEKQAANFLKLDLSTVRRNRRAGRVPFVPTGNGTIRILGVQVCDYILFGAAAVLLWGGKTEPDNDDGSGAPASP